LQKLLKISLIKITVLKKALPLLFLISLVLMSFNSKAQRGELFITGTLKDQNNRPLDFATVKLINLDRITYTNSQGQFRFTINSEESGDLRIRAAMVGKLTIDTLINARDLNKILNLTMQDLSLNLKEVQVAAVRNNSGASNSSVLFDKQAIEQAQAFSLTDVLNNLPGKLYSPVDLQAPKNLTLRTSATDNAALNNSLGTAIIVDGLALSNNANMQNKNIGTYGLSGSLISDRVNQVDYDVTFGGVDLRNIPVDNIESIEVISGVAPAQYGDLTDGAVILTRQAGKTNYQFNTRINGGSTNFSLSKGYQLNGKAGFLNFNFNYLISNNDPRDNLKKYDRVSGGLMYTRYLSPSIKNTFSVDYSEKLDDAKQDPDDGKDLMTYSKDRKISFSNRINFEINKNWLRRVTVNAGGDFGYQESYTQWYINGSPKAMANKDTTGVYEGFYTTGMYTAIDQVVGKPKNFNANLSFLSDFNTVGIKHFLSYGASISVSSNKGKGVLFDPEYPRFANSGSKNERPYNFQLIPTLVNTGVYVEDKFNLKVLQRDLGFQLGLRYDAQNGFGNLQPRLSSRYAISKKLKFNASYGISTKAPTMAYRYPGSTYFDIPLINYYTGDVRNSLLLVYTYKYTPDNSTLKPSKSNQLELGLSYDDKYFSTSIYGYQKNNRDGFNAQSNYFILSVPEYTYTVNAGTKPTYQPTGNYIQKTGLMASIVTNNVSSKNTGVEWFISTRKIKSIQTSFSFNSSLSFSDFYNAGNFVTIAREDDINAGKMAWYGVYSARQYKNTNLTSKINSDTHIPSLGLVVSLYYDFVWRKDVNVLGNNQYPIAYIDKDANYYPIENFDVNNPDYGHLLRSNDVSSLRKLPFMYGNFSMRLSKEIKNKIRFSVNAYNVFNLKSDYYDDIAKKVYNYILPINIGAELSIKF